MTDLEKRMREKYVRIAAYEPKPGRRGFLRYDVVLMLPPFEQVKSSWSKIDRAKTECDDLTRALAKIVEGEHSTLVAENRALRDAAADAIDRNMTEIFTTLRKARELAEKVVAGEAPIAWVRLAAEIIAETEGINE